MLTNSDIQRLLTPGLREEFMKGYESVTTYFEQFTTEIPSTKSEEKYGWLGANPQFREWVDERAPKKLLEKGFTLVNKHFEASISVDRDTLDDDQYGGIKMAAMRMGETARKGYDIEAVAVIEAGHTSICYDGQYFFDTDHSEGDSGTQSNYSASALALEATGANIKTIMTTMEEYKDDRGLNSNVTATHIMIPPCLRWTAYALFKPEALKMTTDATKTVLSGVLDIIVNPYLAKAGTAANSAYYVMDLSKSVKPFVFQNRKAIEFVALDKAEDEANFFRREIYYGADARFAIGYGDWRLCYKAQG